MHNIKVPWHGQTKKIRIPFFWCFHNLSSRKKASPANCMPSFTRTSLDCWSKKIPNKASICHLHKNETGPVETTKQMFLWFYCIFFSLNYPQQIRTRGRSRKYSKVLSFTMSENLRNKRKHPSRAMLAHGMHDGPLKSYS
jgi:hypothetical protein